jgi:hypothetical protein
MNGCFFFLSPVAWSGACVLTRNNTPLPNQVFLLDFLKTMVPIFTPVPLNLIIQSIRPRICLVIWGTH